MGIYGVKPLTNLVLFNEFHEQKTTDHPKLFVYFIITSMNFPLTQSIPDHLRSTHLDQTQLLQFQLSANIFGIPMNLDTHPGCLIINYLRTCSSMIIHVGWIVESDKNCEEILYDPPIILRTPPKTNMELPKLVVWVDVSPFPEKGGIFRFQFQPLVFGVHTPL